MSTYLWLPGYTVMDISEGTIKVEEEKPKHCSSKGTFEKLFGFKLGDFSSWSNFVRLMNRPCHPASLAVFRVCYGLLMFVDACDERGLGNAHNRWAADEMCQFPLIHGVEALQLHWMIVLYLLMIFGASGIILGFMFRISCLMFALPYWYIFLLDKMRWNNHSYLFGLMSVILFFSDANRYWSLDGLIWKRKRNAHIPLWNYFIPRFQLFILYFIAGLKKFDSDWTHGYSMRLSDNWCFAPFRLFFSNETIDMFFVHTAGHMIDLFLVYLLFFDATRIFGIVIGYMFNIMNATMFSIGMFPYMCLVTIPLFCSFDYPVKLFRKFPKWMRFVLPLDSDPQPSDHCIYDKKAIEMAKSHEQNGVGAEQVNQPTKSMKNKIEFYHKFFAAFAIFYASEQLFLPYSHFITQGYNGWTNGLYGYSWDMMIHSWNVQFIKVTYVEKDTGAVGYIRHDAFTSRSNRWSSNADMIKQYASCIESRLASRNKTNIELYFDIWKSMNRRFQQRVVDPRVDILAADWHPFRKTEWLLPLLVDLSDWREELNQLRNETRSTSNFTQTVFVADFPGLHLSNYIQEEIEEVNLTVLSGKVQIELVDRNETYQLTKGQKTKLPVDEFHNVRTISETPSCYYYVYKDKVERESHENYTSVVEKLKAEQNINDEFQLNVTDHADDDNATLLYKKQLRKKQQKASISYYDQFIKYIGRKYNSTQIIWNNIMLAYRIFTSDLDVNEVQKELLKDDPDQYSEGVEREKAYEKEIIYQERIVNHPVYGTVNATSLNNSTLLSNSSSTDT